MENKIDILIDLEFTGLDNSFIKDNEIIQLKMINCSDKEFVSFPHNRVLVNFNSEKSICAYTKIQHKVDRYENCPKFTKDIFFEYVKSLTRESDLNKIKFYGFGVSKDLEMLSKYSINIDIHDIREDLQLSEYEYRLATEGNGLEVAYYLVTGKYPEIKSHSTIDEMWLIYELFLETKKLNKKDYLQYMPFGFCAGMSIEKYVVNYRRAADGHRYNNSDILSEALNYYIDKVDSFDDEDDDYL